MARESGGTGGTLARDRRQSLLLEPAEWDEPLSFFRVPLAGHRRAGWHRLELPRSLAGPDRRLRLLLLGPESDVMPVGVVCLGGELGLTAHAFLPASATAIRLEVTGAAPERRPLHLALQPLSRARAALEIVLRRPWRLLRALRRKPIGAGAGATGRLRAALVAAAAAPAPALDHADWVRLFDTPSAGMLAALDAAVAREAARLPRLRLLLFAGDSAAMAATRQAFGADHPVAVIDGAAALERALDGAAEEYLVALQAGEVVAPHVPALLRLWLHQAGRPAAVYADEDTLDAAGRRLAPLFRPEPSHALMLSGLLTRGLWAFRRDGVTAATMAEAAFAETWRLGQWLRLGTAAAGVRRLPLLLTQRGPGTAAAPGESLGAVLRQHAGQAVAIEDSTRTPLVVRLAGTARPAVALLVPTAARDPVVIGCLKAVLARTRWPELRCIVVLMQPAAPDATQAANLESLARDPRVQVLELLGERFNYSVANNRAAAIADAPLLCQLNDDVEPLAADWLELLVAQMAAPGIGLVGAKLLYPDRTVQHAGVILGRQMLCEHAYLGLAADAPGYAGRACLDQEYAAVTGACTLVRAAVFALLGGHDTRYASAFGDVDFCLRAREAGFGVGWSAGARLLHHETRTFGHHYAGAPAEREAADLARFRKRWSAALLRDPFYHPALSLDAGEAWVPAVPPRVTRAGIIRDLVGPAALNAGAVRVAGPTRYSHAE